MVTLEYSPSDLPNLHYGEYIAPECKYEGLIDSSRRIAKQIGYFSLTFVSVAAVCWWFDLLEDEDEAEDANANKSTISIKIVRDSPPAEQSEAAAKTEEEDEDDVDIPEEMPEDAIFIPLGFTHQRPQEFYKGSDPEWQSFIEFRKDREREKAVRSMILSRTEKLLNTNMGIEELAALVGSYLTGMKSMQRHLGMPVKVKQFWIDVIVPDGPPPEYERRGYVIESTDKVRC